MKRINVIALAALALVLFASAAATEAQGKNVTQQVGYAFPLDGSLAALTPGNTVILSNETDGAFCQDFSVLLKNLRLEWITLDSAEVPKAVRDKNLVIVGRLDSEYTGHIIAKLLTPEQAISVRQGGPHVFEKDSPWNEERGVYVSAGSDLLLTKKAAEAAITSIVENSQARREEWYASFSDDSRDEVEAHIARLQHTPEGDELPQEALRMDVGAKPPGKISAQEAAQDVEHLFYLLSHGWCGYSYFEAKGDFDQAKQDILEKLDEKSKWSSNDLSQLLHEHLGFIHDCHLKVGNRQYCSHLDFWYDTSLELWQSKGQYYFVSDDVEYAVVAVNGEPPREYAFPSLSAQGDPMYRLGTLAYAAPAPLLLTAQNGQEQKQFEIKLRLSDFYSKSKFGEERIGGIPVLRVRSFADYYSDELSQFLQAADKYKGEPYVIVDIRGNTGGSTRWPKEWIARFTGHSPSLKQALTELTNKTTMMGRLNVFQEMLATYPEEDAAWVQGQINYYQALAEAFESKTPYWSPLTFPSTRLIPNASTLIVIADGGVASAGEGFLSYLYRQVENVVVVGENSLGALTFGQVSFHQLPYSRLRVVLPIKLNVPLDMEWREEKGYFPDLWVPAVDALNYTVAAARKGTITTPGDLPTGYFDAEFVPEKHLRRTWLDEHKKDLVLTAYLLVCGIVFGYTFREKTPFFFIAGSGSLVAGIIAASEGRSMGYLLLPCGAVFLAIGMYKRTRTA
jgi:hypothetical protein